MVCKDWSIIGDHLYVGKLWGGRIILTYFKILLWGKNNQMIMETLPKLGWLTRLQRNHKVRYGYIENQLTKPKATEMVPWIDAG